MAGKIVIVGGGWAGCAAALTAAQNGAGVTLLERTDMLLGTGLVGGIMRNNGRFTACEECIAMGGGAIFQTIDSHARHVNVSFPGHQHATLYDIAQVPGAIERMLEQFRVKVYRLSRIHALKKTAHDALESVTDDNGHTYSADVFIDTTGTAGPISMCSKYGNGCAMCILRCPSFGGRISLTALAGLTELQAKNTAGSIGAMSGSCKLYKDSLSKEINELLNTVGVAIVPVPKHLIQDHRANKACQQYTASDFKDNLILLDTGHAKLMTPFFALESLHKIPGLENARYADPYAGGKGNSIRFTEIAPCDDGMRVQGMRNLYCAGEKSGILVGHTEAIVTGVLAGYNAARQVRGLPDIVLPTQTVIGDAIHFVRESMKQDAGLDKRYTFSGSVLFQHMIDKGTYTTDVKKIQSNIKNLGLTDLFYPA